MEETTTTEIAIIDPKDFQIEPAKAVDIQLAFEPKRVEMSIITLEFLELQKTEITEAVVPAKELKKKILAFEKEVTAIHKSQKDFYLNGGRFVDANKNLFISQTDSYKKSLDAIIKQDEIKKKAEADAILEKRKTILLEYMEDIDYLNDSLVSMTDDVFEVFISARKEDKRISDLKKDSDRIISEIYTSTDLSSFDPIYKEHIDIRLGQLLLEKKNKISSLKADEKLDFDITLEPEDLQQLYNEKLIEFEGFKTEALRVKMETEYSKCLTAINTDLEKGAEGIEDLKGMDFGEFSEEWTSKLEKLQQVFDLKVEENKISKAKEDSEKIIAEIYKATDLRDFDPVFQEHIDIRKTQLLTEKKNKISNLKLGIELDFDIELESEELKELYSDKMEELEEKRKDDHATNMRAVYSNCLHSINTNITTAQVAIDSAKTNKFEEFDKDFALKIVELQSIFDKKKESLSSIYRKLTGAKFSNGKVNHSNDTFFCDFNDLTPEHIDLFLPVEKTIKEASLSTDDLYLDWVNSFSLNDFSAPSERSKQVIEKFEGFKKWALNLK